VSTVGKFGIPCAHRTRWLSQRVSRGSKSGSRRKRRAVGTLNLKQWGWRVAVAVAGVTADARAIGDHASDRKLRASIARGEVGGRSCASECLWKSPKNSQLFHGVRYRYCPLRAPKLSSVQVVAILPLTVACPLWLLSQPLGRDRCNQQPKFS
jgi:hypothetical protein